MSIRDGGRVSVSTRSQGNAGKLLVQARDSVEVVGMLPEFGASRLIANVTPRGRGAGGGLTIETKRLSVRDGGQVSVGTSGQGDAGVLQVSADSVEVVGRSQDGQLKSEISAAVAQNSTGSGGSLRIDTGKLIVRDSGTVTVNTENTKPAGTLEIYADSIKLDNQGSITATTKSGDGGDITLGVRDFLLLRRGSEISTTAGTAGAGGDGGDITINSPFIIAFPNENSDITANAFSGNGGKITIKTQGLFGITPLSRQELEQRLNTTDFTLLDSRNLPTSDITAISQNNPNLSGTVNINTPDVDPSQGLFELPETVIDPAQQIAQNPCLRGGGEFIITGRGGFPSNPNKILSSDNVRVDLVKPVASTTRNSTSTTKSQPSTSATDKPIVPARGWIFNEKGEVTLVAYDPTKTGVQRSSPTPASSCAAVR
ncbi:MAG: S-layer family protein [Scytonema sp. CRU_2_7]|nr:S-layer family protein [Scytonema sp. CRU_2_7]